MTMNASFMQSISQLCGVTIASRQQVSESSSWARAFSCFAASTLRHWVLGVVLLTSFFSVTSVAWAQSAVSGVIATDTHWTVAQSPYIVSGDVIIQNGATLRIDLGVTIYMAPNSGLTIQAGALRAEGVESSPIRVLSDKTRQGQTAAPGDWKHWVFNSGTTNTRLDFVIFEHGSGLLIKGSSPTINYAVLRNHAGPAMEVDLSASPSGVGNQATGNTLNGVLVPSGDIVGNVKWGIRGIPYVVSSGVISVGASPNISSVIPNTLLQGETATINVTGSRLQGLSNVHFSKAGLRAEILPGATDSQAALSVSAESIAPAGATDLRLEVDAGEVRLPNALSVVQSQPVITTLLPSSLHLGQGGVEVNINGRNFTNQSVVMVNDIEVATQYQSATQLNINLTPPGTAGNLRIQLKTPNPRQSGQYLLSNEWLLPVVAAQITVSPAAVSVVKGGNRVLVVSLPYTAPAGGLSVNLVSSVPTVATVPATVLVPEGQASASVQLSGTELGNTVITASRVGFVSGQSQVAVIAPPTLSLTPASATLGTGRTVEMTLQSSNPADPSGLSVGLTSSDSSIATIPASVTIPAGTSRAIFAVNTIAIGNATITAQAPDFASATALVTVRPVSLNLPAGALVAPGLTRSIPITLSDPAPAGGLALTLSSSAPAIASVPTTLNIAEGQTTGNFILTGVAAGTALSNEV